MSVGLRPSLGRQVEEACRQVLRQHLREARYRRDELERDRLHKQAEEARRRQRELAELELCQRVLAAVQL